MPTRAGRELSKERAERVQRFKDARNILHISQEKAGQIVGKSQKQVSDYELGLCAPSERSVRLLEDMLREKFGEIEAQKLLANISKIKLPSVSVLPESFFLCQTLTIITKLPIHEALHVSQFDEWLKTAIQKALNK